MNVRQVRKKIKSVSNVKKITKSMQLVSAIKMKKSQQNAIDGRPYYFHLEEIITKITRKIEKIQSPLLTLSPKSTDKPDLILLISTNKGLCGSFNVDLIRYVTIHFDLNKCHFLTIGKKGSQYVAKLRGIIDADFSSTMPIQNVSALVSYAIRAFLQNTYRKVYIVYNEFISTLKTKPKSTQILPYTVEIPKTDILQKRNYVDYIIEPNPQAVIEMILHSFIEESVRHAIIQSEAGEHSARMVAMKNATDNANDVIYNLTLLSNKLRQEKITNELLDMVTAKESVEL